MDIGIKVRLISTRSNKDNEITINTRHTMLIPQPKQMRHCPTAKSDGVIGDDKQELEDKRQKRIQSLYLKKCNNCYTVTTLFYDLLI